MSYQTELQNKNRGYMNLIVWQRAMDLFEVAWKLGYVEAQVDFKLRSQFVDAAQSVSANICGRIRSSIHQRIHTIFIYRPWIHGRNAYTERLDCIEQSSFRPSDSRTSTGYITK